MHTLREKIRVAGIVLFLIGMLCLPFPRTNPKSALSVFEVFAELGLLWKFGLAAMVFGIIVFLASFFMKR